MRHVINGNEVITLYYCPDVNVFTKDYLGQIVFDIFRLITPGQLMLFKNNKKDYLIPDITNSFMVELLYPDEELLPYFYEYN